MSFRHLDCAMAVARFLRVPRCGAPVKVHAGAGPRLYCDVDCTRDARAERQRVVEPVHHLQLLLFPPPATSFFELRHLPMRGRE